MKSLKYIAAIAIACAGFMGVAPKVSATTLSFGDANDLGEVLFGIPSGNAARTRYVNHLIDMLPGTSDTFSGQTFNRSTANPGPGYPNYPNAVFALNGTTTSIDLGSTAGFYCYLFAKYDGPNYGSEVWYVGDLTGVITIPANSPGRHGYGLSGWTLFTCDDGGGRVPEGGWTIALLGLALGGVELLRRTVLSRRAVKV
jgi:hypothetical protein